MEKAFVATLVVLSFIALGASSLLVLGNLSNGMMGIGHMGMMYDNDGIFSEDHECYESGEGHEYCEEYYEETGQDCENIDNEHYEECEEHIHHHEDHEGSGYSYYPCH